MKTAWKTLTVAAMMFAGVGAAQAAGPGGCMDGDGPQHDGRHIGMMSKQLGLTAAQSAQVKEIFAKNRDEVKPLMEKMRVERKAMHDLIHGDSLDEAAVRAQSAKVAAVQADLAVERARMFQQIRPILTPEQLKKVKEMPDKRQHMGKRSGRGPGMGPRP